MSEVETTHEVIQVVGENNPANYRMLLQEVVRLNSECRRIIAEVDTVEEFSARLKESNFDLTDNVIQQLYDVFTHEIKFPTVGDRPFATLPEPISYFTRETYNTGRQSCAYGVRPNERHRDLLSAKGRKFL